jgi:hypothetical protein
MSSFSLLYILNNRVADPMVVKTVSNVKVSSEILMAGSVPSKVLSFWQALSIKRKEIKRKNIIFLDDI